MIAPKIWFKFLRGNGSNSEIRNSNISSQFTELYGSIYTKITLIQQVKVVAHRVQELKRDNKLLLTRE